jgi:HD-GYP domain-containing protein (c-di-GMP phosphodiesterase class II)
MKIVEFKKKMPKFLILPLIVLLGLSLYSGIIKYEEKEALVTINESMKFTQVASNVIHELQKERGLSSGFSASSGKTFSDELKQQRKVTDAKIKLLYKYLDSPQYIKFKLPFEKPTKELLEPLRDIEDFRTDIDKLVVLDIVDYYTNYISILLKHVNRIIALANKGELVSLIESYLIIIEIKEKAGIERALINKVFGQGSLSNYELYKFGELVSAQEIYLKHFNRSAKEEYINMFDRQEVKNGFEEVDKDRNIIYTKIKKNNILADIKELIGYGGFIHNFKNYILRGEEKYIKNVQEQYAKLIVAIDNYESFEDMDDEELNQLKILKDTFATYMEGVQTAKAAYKDGVSINRLDELVKVDADTAKQALKNLKTNIYGSQLNWFEHATNKINLLKDIEDDIALDIVVFIKDYKINLFIQLVVQIITLVIILVIIMASFIVLRQLIESKRMLNRAQKNTKSGSFEYYIQEDMIFWSKEQYKLLQQDKKTFHPTLESFLKFVHPDDLYIVQYNLDLAEMSKKLVSFEYRIILPDNTEIFVVSSAEVIKYTVHGKPLVMIGTITDISEAKKLEQEIVDTQKDVIFTLGAVGETRSQETGQHVKRVAEYSKLLYWLVGAKEEESELLKMASPMHDIGKIGIPDDILNKPGKLTPNEWAIMKTHSEMGYEMLKNSNREILRLAATIALSHHEKYDGSGYPKGLLANEIPIVGRITALADVFDALGSERCYKRAWEIDEILELIKQERAKHFDPQLVDLFLENLDKFLEIRDMHKDII